MTATDELRRMLDERGVKWDGWGQRAYGRGTVYEGEYDTVWTADSGELLSILCETTPEQAIEATLGRGTCRLIDEDNYNEAEGCDAYSWFRCSACGWTFDEDDRWLTTMSFCPNCGRRVVAGDEP